MSLFGLGLLPTAAIAVGMAALLVFFYSVRFRLPRRVVGTTELWRGVLAGKAGGGRLGAFESTVSLVLQLLIAALLVVSLAQPRFSFQRQAGRHVVLVLDRSPSMGTRERIETRLETAKRLALRRIGRMAGEDEVALVLRGGRSEVAVSLGRDLKRVREMVADAELRASGGTLADAVELACRQLTGLDQAGVIVVTDGTERFNACEGAELEVITVGELRPNVGITSFDVAVPPAARTAQAFVEIHNDSTQTAHVELRLDLDGRLLRVASIEIKERSSERRTFDSIPLSGDGKVIARLSKIELSEGAKDALAADDLAYAVVPHRKTLNIELMGASRVVKLVLEANPDYRVSERSPGSAPRPGAVQVLTGEIKESLGAGRYLLFNPSGAGSPAPVIGTAGDLFITRVSDEHPVLRRVVLSDVMIGKASRVRLPSTAVSLIGSPDTPLAFAMEDGPLRVVGFPFDLAATNLFLRVGFPVLVYNSIDWLAGRSDAGEGEDPSGYSVVSDVSLELRTAGLPPKRIEPVGGRVTFTPGAPGFYDLVEPGQGKPLQTYALSVTSSVETAISPLPASELPAERGQRGRLRDQEVWIGLVVLALVLLLLEWLSYHRRVTV